MSGLFGLFNRSIENPALPLTNLALLDYLGMTNSSDAGVPVTPQGSLAMSAVWRGTVLISQLGGALPMHTYEGDDKVDTPLLDNPHPDLTTYEFWRLGYVHRCLWGNCYYQKIRDNMRRVRWLYPMSPWRVKVGKARKPVEGNPTGKVFEFTDDSGNHHELTPNEVFHIPGFGYDGVTGVSPVRAATNAIGLALAAEQSAGRLFASGNLLSGVLQTEQRLNRDQADALQKRWREKFSGSGRAHEVAVLDAGTSFESMTMPSADAQMLESRDFQVTELARFFGVPPYLMFQTMKSTSWGTGLEQQATGFVKFDLHPGWLAPTEQRVTKDLLPSGRRAKYAVEGLLRGDTQSRAEFYRVMREVGAFSANDIRRLEDLPPVQDGDGLLQPMNMAPLGTSLEDLMAAKSPALGAPASKNPSPNKVPRSEGHNEDA